jgi:hypothetical protein
VRHEVLVVAWELVLGEGWELVAWVLGPVWDQVLDQEWAPELVCPGNLHSNYKTSSNL